MNNSGELQIVPLTFAPTPNMHWGLTSNLFHYSVIATLRAGFQADNAEEKAFWESSL